MYAASAHVPRTSVQTLSVFGFGMVLSPSADAVQCLNQRNEEVDVVHKFNSTRHYCSSKSDFASSNDRNHSTQIQMRKFTTNLLDDVLTEKILPAQNFRRIELNLSTPKPVVHSADKVDDHEQPKTPIESREIASRRRETQKRERARLHLCTKH